MAGTSPAMTARREGCFSDALAKADRFLEGTMWI
jgi:hypothetical protein